MLYERNKIIWNVGHHCVGMACVGMYVTITVFAGSSVLFVEFNKQNSTACTCSFFLTHGNLCVQVQQEKVRGVSKAGLKKSAFQSSGTSRFSFWASSLIFILTCPIGKGSGKSSAN